MIKAGDKVFINGKEYILGERIGGGLEGNIFNVVDLPNYVIKIINDKNMTQAQRNEIYTHLKWLKELGEKGSGIKQYMSVPKALLDDHLGYVMVKAASHESLKKYISIPDDMEKFDDWYVNKYSLKKRYQIIIGIFSALRTIHLSGLIFTDLSPNNIMVHKTKNQIVFIDTDNTRRRTDHYQGVLGTPGYMAPEVYRKPDNNLAKEYNVDPSLLFNCGRLSNDTDIFSAAVIAFQLLTLQHPFIGDEIEEGTPEDEEAALEIKTDYIFKEGTANTSSYGLTSKFEEITTEEIRYLFKRTFVDGKDNPSLRPTAVEFLEAFQNAYDLIITCPHCGFPRLYNCNQDNECINCGDRFEKKVLLVIHNVFYNLTRAEVINNIGDYPQYDVSMEGLTGIGGELPPDCIEVSRIVLEPGEANAKYLYLHHFEKTTDRSEMYARVVLSESLNSVRVEVLKDYLKDPIIVNKLTGKMYHLDKGKEFSLDNYRINFESQKLGKGYLKIICEFIKD